MKKSFSFMMATVMACSAVPVSSAFATETAAVSTVASELTTEELKQILAEKEAELEAAKDTLKDAQDTEADLKDALAEAQKVEATLADLQANNVGTTAEDEEVVELTEEEIAAQEAAIEAARTAVDALEKSSAELALDVIAAQAAVTEATTAVANATTAVQEAEEAVTEAETVSIEVHLDDNSETNATDFEAFFANTSTGSTYKWNHTIVTSPSNGTTYMNAYKSFLSAYNTLLSLTEEDDNATATTKQTAYDNLETAKEEFEAISLDWTGTNVSSSERTRFLETYEKLASKEESSSTDGITVSDMNTQFTKWSTNTDVNGNYKEDESTNGHDGTLTTKLVIGAATGKVAYDDAVLKSETDLTDAELRLEFGSVTAPTSYEKWTRISFDLDLSGATFDTSVVTAYDENDATTNHALKNSDKAVRLLNSSSKYFDSTNITDSYFNVTYNKTNNATSATIDVYIYDADGSTIVDDFFKNNAGVAINLKDWVSMNSGSVGASAYATFSSNTDGLTISNDGSALNFANVISQGMTASIKTMDYVAEEEVISLDNPLMISETVAGSFAYDATEKEGTILKLTINSGFDFYHNDAKVILRNISDGEVAATLNADGLDKNDGIITIDFAEFNNFAWAKDATARYRIEIEGLEIEATTAKSGDEAIITVNADGMSRVTCPVAEVTAYAVDLYVDEDLSVPVMYNGVDAKNTGLTTGSDQNWSKVITLEESFQGAWAGRNAFSFVLPDGVYVADVDILANENFNFTIDSNTYPITDGAGETPKNDDGKEYGLAGKYSWEYKFAQAYENGDYKAFEFSRRTFDDVTTSNDSGKAKLSFRLELVAEPDFEGEVVFTTEGIDLNMGDNGVVIAEFISPYTAQAFQNNVIIDYRYTPIDTDITVRETEPGLWATDTSFYLYIDRATDIVLENGASFNVASSDMQLRSAGTKVNDDPSTATSHMQFQVRTESTTDAAEIVIGDMELYMKRDIPAGAYSLSIDSTMEQAFNEQKLFEGFQGTDVLNTETDFGAYDSAFNSSGVEYKTYYDCVKEFSSYSDVVAGGESFVNVVTAGSDVGDATFLTSIVVPIGGTVMIVGGVVQPLSTSTTAPSTSYINADGYTMLPVRAIADAVGSAGIEVLWNGDNSTVTILYPGTVVNMRVGEKIMTINGNEVPSSAALEIYQDRAYLPLRDLARAIGVDTSRIAYDSYQHAAIINGTESDIYTILKTAGLDKDTVGATTGGTATTIPSGDDEEEVADID